MLNLEEFEGALEALTIAQELGSPQNKCKKLIVKCQAQLEGNLSSLSVIDVQSYRNSMPSKGVIPIITSRISMQSSSLTRLIE